MKEKAKLTEAEIERLLAAEFPQMFNPQGGFSIDAVWFRGCRVRKRFDPQSLRPGGTIAGTTMMALADLGPYVAIHASIGWAPMAVTTNLSINFLKRPAQKDLLAETTTDQARQAACRGGHRHPLGRGGGARRPRHLDLLDPASSLVSGEIIPPTHIIEIVSKYWFAAVDREADCS